MLKPDPKRWRVGNEGIEIFSTHPSEGVLRHHRYEMPSATRSTPRQNRLLATLPREGYERLLPHLVPVAWPSGSTVHAAGDREDCLHFITAGIVSRVCVTDDGGAAEFAITGSEGVIGVASFLSGESTLSHAVALSTVRSYRLPADLLKTEFERAGPLSHMLLRYTQALIAQTAQIAVCSRHHTLEKRLVRWILSCLDRLPSNELTATQKRVAELLGVRRVGVTAALGKLQSRGLIRCSRGRIVALDRSQLEARACECYAVVKREYDRLLRPGNVIGNAGAHDMHRPRPQMPEDHVAVH